MSKIDKLVIRLLYTEGGKKIQNNESMKYFASKLFISTTSPSFCLNEGDAPKEDPWSSACTAYQLHIPSMFSMYCIMSYFFPLQNIFLFGHNEELT